MVHREEESQFGLGKFESRVLVEEDGRESEETEEEEEEEERGGDEERREKGEELEKVR